MLEKKRKPKRSKVKNPSLKKGYNSKIRQEYIDMDYIDKLDDTVRNCELPDGTPCTELEYMSLFMKEWNNASVVGVKDKTDKTAKENKFHRTAKEAKECTDRNNARNRCTYGILKARNLMMPKTHEELQGLIESEAKRTDNYVEDALIDFLDDVHDFENTTEDGDDNT